jgi:hypothetical protein
MLDRRAGPKLLVVVLALAACVAPPRPAPAPASPTVAAAPGTVYEVTASDVTVRVYRDGPLASLGHNHVIASTGVAGQFVVREPLPASSFEIELPLASLTVDAPERRAAAGEDFPGELAAADRDGTRRNMLGPALLAAQRFPVIRMEGLSILPRGETLEVMTRVEIAGGTRVLIVPAEMRREADMLEVHGRFTVTHAELGLAPFSVAFGALRVREDMHVEFRLSARRTAPAP